MLRVFKRTICVGIALLSLSFSQMAIGDISRKLADEKEIQEILGATLQRPGRMTNVTFKNCQLDVEYVFEESCSVRFKIADSITNMSLREVTRVEVDDLRKPGFIEFWFEDDVVDVLKERRERSTMAKNISGDGVFFREKYYYCDGTQAPSKSISWSKVFFIETKPHGQLSKLLNTYNKKHCLPGKKL